MNNKNTPLAICVDNVYHPNKYIPVIRSYYGEIEVQVLFMNKFQLSKQTIDAIE